MLVFAQQPRLGFPQGWESVSQRLGRDRPGKTSSCIHALLPPPSTRTLQSPEIPRYHSRGYTARFRPYLMHPWYQGEFSDHLYCSLMRSISASSLAACISRRPQFFPRQLFSGLKINLCVSKISPKEFLLLALNLHNIPSIIYSTHRSQNRGTPPTHFVWKLK